MANEKPFKLDMGFAEALRRFARTSKSEADSNANAEQEKFERVDKRIKKAKEEVARGARTGKPPFRL